MNRKETYSATYKAIFQSNMPGKMTWGTSQADIVSEGRGFIGAFDYTMQLQVGCPGGCLFCYVPAAARLAPTKVRGSKGENWGFVVRNKEAVIAKLKKHLHSGRLAEKTIYWSGVTDPYAAPPAITAELWETLLCTPDSLKPKRIVIQTRFRPDRDIELICQYQKATTPSDGGPPVLVSYSIGTDRNDLIQAWEKSTPLFEHRMAAIAKLRQFDVFIVATLSPFCLWDDLVGTLRQFKAWKLAYITCLFMKVNTMSANTPAGFTGYVRANYPELLDPRWQREQLRMMQDIYEPGRVLVGKKGFESLVNPHKVVNAV